MAQINLNRVIIQPGETPGWGTPYGDYSVSINSTVFFENYDAIYVKQLGQKLLAKKYQSFAGSGGRGTVYYMEFALNADMNKILSFAKKMIWEGSSPSQAHPEKIFNKENVLVIVSCRNSSFANQIENLIRR